MTDEPVLWSVFARGRGGAKSSYSKAGIKPSKKRKRVPPKSKGNVDDVRCGAKLLEWLQNHKPNNDVISEPSPNTDDVIIERSGMPYTDTPVPSSACVVDAESLIHDDDDVCVSGVAGLAGVVCMSDVSDMELQTVRQGVERLQAEIVFQTEGSAVDMKQTRRNSL